MGQEYFGIFVAFVGGVFCILGAILNWNFFFESRRAYIFVKMLGRTGARIFYVGLGVFLLFVGIQIIQAL